MLGTTGSDHRSDSVAEQHVEGASRSARSRSHCGANPFPTLRSWRYPRIVSAEDPIEELAGLFLFLADTDLAGYCPIYERLARAIAVDHDLLRFIDQAASPNTRRGRIPVLFFAATHDRVLANPDSVLASIYRGELDDDPMAMFNELIQQERDALVEIMRTRSVQTNEVGRSAVLEVALSRACSDVIAPPSVFEIGPSAGLNLFFDRFCIHYSREGHDVAFHGPPESTVQLTCELRGPNSPDFHSPGISPSKRSGIDPSPIDVTSDEECRWLRACVWPGMSERHQRLTAALSIARTDPPTLLAGDAVTDLRSALERIDPSDHLLVFSTWALAYVNAEGRQEILRTIDELGADRDLDLITFEEPRFTPWVTEFDRSVYDQYWGEGTPTLLGLRSWRGGRSTTSALGVAHPHGRWIHWLEERHG